MTSLKISRLIDRRMRVESFEVLEG